MPKAELKKEIQTLLTRSGSIDSLASLMDEISGILTRHADALSPINSRYRLEATDTGSVCAFALENGVYRPLEAAGEADVCLLGREEDLMRIFRGELSPMAALLCGKVKIRGSKSALMQFAEFF